jgi:N-acetylmuramoyl-L-alanine amidase
MGVRRIGEGLGALVPAAIGVALVAIASAGSAAPEAVITSVRAERRGEALDLIFALSGATRLHASHRGNELQIKLERTRVQIPARPLFGAESAPLSILRAIDDPGGNSRLIFEVRGKTDYAMARFPREIVIRLAPAGRVPDLAAPLLARRTDSERERSAETVLLRPARNHAEPSPRQATTALPPYSGDGERVVGHARVLIDPGHGGRDPGTSDSTGRLVEKDLALRISRRVALALRARGVSADLSRNSDTFLTLPERTHLANQIDADLFVSIHLNWSPNPGTSGIEVYYLNNTTDRAAIRLARLENGAGYSVHDEPNLNYILGDLRRNYKAAASASLARMIEENTVAELDQAFAGVNALGAKTAPFYVLIGAGMPAVLLECGFLSNRAEAERLAFDSYQQRLADGIAAAVVRYLNSNLTIGDL